MYPRAKQFLNSKETGSTITNKDNNSLTSYDQINTFNAELLNSPPKNIFAEVSSIIMKSSDKKTSSKNYEPSEENLDKDKKEFSEND